MSQSRPVLRHRLPPHAASVGEARRWVRRVLAAAGHHALVEPAQLLVSEIVTNALLHTNTAIDISARIDTNTVRVEVGDGSRHAPALRHYTGATSTGFGLALVEQVAQAWGVTPSIRGKSLWFQLSTGGDAETPAAVATANGHRLAAVADPGTDGADLVVELLNVPLLLVAVWRRHAETMLREYLLAGIGSDEPGALGVHAAATDALRILDEHIPHAPRLGDDPRQTMIVASEPHATAPAVKVPIPAGSAGHFATLETALETAMRLADAGALLSPPQPELRSLRRWLCAQVQQQHLGMLPTPWPATDEPAPPPRRVLSWDSSAVTHAAGAVLGVDDTGRVVAVSAGALSMLGCTRPQQLVGRRVTMIVPPRFRQAFLAGFIWHQLSDQPGPFVTGGTVAVPLLRRDGGELITDLGVVVHRPGRGRTLFVATLHPAEADVLGA